MGFSELVTQIILVFLFILIFLTLFNSYKTYVESTSEQANYMLDQIVSRVQTNFEILDANYTAGNLVLTLKNTGSTKLNTDLMDAYIGGEKVSRNDLSFVMFNKTSSDLLWGPTEALNISLSKVISGRTLIQISSEYGISAYHQIMVE